MNINFKVQRVIENLEKLRRLDEIYGNLNYGSDIYQDEDIKTLVKMFQITANSLDELTDVWGELEGILEEENAGSPEFGKRFEQYSKEIDYAIDN